MYVCPSVYSLRNHSYLVRYSFVGRSIRCLYGVRPRRKVAESKKRRFWWRAVCYRIYQKDILKSQRVHGNWKTVCEWHDIKFQRKLSTYFIFMVSTSIRIESNSCITWMKWLDNIFFLKKLRLIFQLFQEWKILNEKFKLKSFFSLTKFMITLNIYCAVNLFKIDPNGLKIFKTQNGDSFLRTKNVLKPKKNLNNLNILEKEKSLRMLWFFFFLWFHFTLFRSSPFKARTSVHWYAWMTRELEFQQWVQITVSTKKSILIH